MRLAASLVCFQPYLRQAGLVSGLHGVAKALRESGIFGLELQISPHMSISQYLSVLHIVRQYSISVCSIHAEKDLFPTPKQDSLQRLAVCLQIFNPELVVVHPVITDSFLQELDQSVKWIEHRSNRSCLWTLELICRDPNLLHFPWEMVSSVGMTLDIYHAYQLGLDPLQAIIKYKHLLYNVHLRECFFAQSDFPGYAKEIMRMLYRVGYTGQITLELTIDSMSQLMVLADQYHSVRKEMSGR